MSCRAGYYLVLAGVAAHAREEVVVVDVVDIDRDQLAGEIERVPAPALEVGDHLLGVLRPVAVPRMAPPRRRALGELLSDLLRGLGAVNLDEAGVVPAVEVAERIDVRPRIEVAFRDDRDACVELALDDREEDRERRLLDRRLRLVVAPEDLVEALLERVLDDERQAEPARQLARDARLAARGRSCHDEQERLQERRSRRRTYCRIPP